ncbi:hypothetical protein O6H91_07G127100 [Diphasiastrum complanatum]|uniref:Uncharacterized protein n=1 Tax=Diphasiastrum complanatum TaxID=34168 RepID=A0ACC2DA51_DIPCM|nr:hypothetical protein O6H91_Y311100 [Diphasiastrum complanatum]KAJ7550972.1 hypothetical protein O6H91_07G127100 [Diphasiastrum complanatum]
MGSQRLLMMSSNSGGYDAVVSDFQALGLVAHDLSVHTAGLIALSVTDFGVLRWLAFIAAIFLLIIDRTNWRTNFLTALLVPYVVLNLPPILFNFLRGEIGKWIAFVAVVIRLFFPNLVRDKFELPAAIVILLVTLPSLIANQFRDSIFAIIVSLIIGAYLLHQHIQATGGFRNAFAAKRGIPITIGILLLFVSPLWDTVSFIK